MINELVDKVFLVNLDSRKDRLEISDCALKEQGIEYERFPAVYDVNGVKGLLLSMRNLFRLCIAMNYTKGVLVFEDDVEFLLPIVPFLRECLPQLPKDYLTFHLGLNLLSVPKRVSPNLLLIDQSYSTHAIIYSFEAVKLLLPLLERPENKAYDILMRDELQIYCRSYASFPMIATQRTNHSDIEGKEINWKDLSVSSYNRLTKDLQRMEEIAYCNNGHLINWTRYEETIDPLRLEVQHPELIGKVCDCKRMTYFEEQCNCGSPEWRIVWKENINS